MTPMLVTIAFAAVTATGLSPVNDLELRLNLLRKWRAEMSAAERGHLDNMLHRLQKLRLEKSSEVSTSDAESTSDSRTLGAEFETDTEPAPRPGPPAKSEPSSNPRSFDRKERAAGTLDQNKPAMTHRLAEIRDKISNNPELAHDPQVLAAYRRVSAKLDRQQLRTDGAFEREPFAAATRPAELEAKAMAAPKLATAIENKAENAAELTHRATAEVVARQDHPGTPLLAEQRETDKIIAEAEAKLERVSRDAWPEEASLIADAKAHLRRVKAELDSEHAQAQHGTALAKSLSSGQQYVSALDSIISSAASTEKETDTDAATLQSVAANVVHADAERAEQISDRLATVLGGVSSLAADLTKDPSLLHDSHELRGVMEALQRNIHTLEKMNEAANVREATEMQAGEARTKAAAAELTKQKERVLERLQEQAEERAEAAMEASAANKAKREKTASDHAHAPAEVERAKLSTQAEEAAPVTTKTPGNALLPKSTFAAFPTPVLPSMLERAKKAVSEGDRDGDGMSRSEFKARVVSSEQFQDVVFEALDLNRDGKMDAEPFQAVLELEGRDSGAANPKPHLVRRASDASAAAAVMPAASEVEKLEPSSPAPASDLAVSPVRTKTSAPAAKPAAKKVGVPPQWAAEPKRTAPAVKLEKKSAGDKLAAATPRKKMPTVRAASSPPAQTVIAPRLEQALAVAKPPAPKPASSPTKQLQALSKSSAVPAPAARKLEKVSPAHSLDAELMAMREELRAARAEAAAANRAAQTIALREELHAARADAAAANAAAAAAAPLSSAAATAAFPATLEDHAQPADSYHSLQGQGTVV